MVQRSRKPVRSHSGQRRNRRAFLQVLESRRVLAAVPAFESLPGADHTVFLDFDGQAVEGTNWNSYYNQTTLNANPYDIDGAPATFSATELSRIEEAYLRVAEDFRPFNVNVTTIDPGTAKLQKSGSGDTQWGVRVIITKESTMVNDSAEYCGCGGIAYINSFNSSNDLPVWVFTSGGKSVAEAASHEVGHALGLSHDGTSTAGYYSGHGDGDIGWASIMGVGYYENVSQWDDGTFYDSNNGGSGANYNKGPDDLAVITTYNGFGYRADDHGDDLGSASPASINGIAIDDSGVIETSSDVDVFSLTTGAGLISLNVDTFLPGPNLDIQADLFDSSGSLVASSNPTTGLNASISVNVAAGQYFLKVDGVGVGDPTSSTPTGYSDYASLGSYAVTGTIVDPGTIAQVTVGDVTVSESAGTATFSVSLSGSISGDVSLDYSTADDSAISPADFAATSGSLIFSPGGSTTQTVTVPIVDDGEVEGVESFFMNLSNPSDVLIADGQAVATINDNDASVSITDASANEGNLAKGKKNASNTNYKDMVFIVSLSNPVDQVVDVTWSTSDATADTANNDYEAGSGVLTIAAGATSGTITVRVIGDNDPESDETFTVSLTSMSGDALAGVEGTGTILDDDSSGGGGKGGGKNKPSKAPADLASIDDLLVVDELWYFEEVGRQGHDDDGDTDQDKPASALALIAAVRVEHAKEIRRGTPNDIAKSFDHALKIIGGRDMETSSDAVDRGVAIHEGNDQDERGEEQPSDGESSWSLDDSLLV